MLELQPNKEKKSIRFIFSDAKTGKRQIVKEFDIKKCEEIAWVLLIITSDFIKQQTREQRMAKKFIQEASKKPGTLRKSLDVKKGKKIPEAKLEKAEHSKNAKIKKHAIVAETLKGWIRK